MFKLYHEIKFQKYEIIIVTISKVFSNSERSLTEIFEGSEENVSHLQILILDLLRLAVIKMNLQFDCWSGL